MKFFIYNTNFYSICKSDIQDIILLDQLFVEMGYDINYTVWSVEDYLFYLAKRNSVLTVVRYQKIIAFCLSVINADESELYKIVVDKQFRGKGIGKFLILYHIGFLKFNGVKASFLEVSSENSHAINLYKKIGYEIINVRKKYYASVDAFVMKKLL
ncbi:MAG: N-acetyltransferase [Candidatus Calescibacterium sp.]|nr:GNAT family N-acetyltransferase [Candidatus Calescibacterium sp.]MDW8132030.1 N-acetyltransferase [Candidatus Calescibacterium sp.]